MNQKDLNRFLNLHRSGVSKLTCTKAILETFLINIDFSVIDDAAKLIFAFYEYSNNTTTTTKVQKPQSRFVNNDFPENISAQIAAGLEKEIS